MFVFLFFCINTDNTFLRRGYGWVALEPLYPIHSDTECFDTTSGLKNKQDTRMVSAFNNILWLFSSTFSYGKYVRYFEDIMRNGDNLQTFV